MRSNLSQIFLAAKSADRLGSLLKGPQTLKIGQRVIPFRVRHIARIDQANFAIGKHVYVSLFESEGVEAEGYGESNSRFDAITSCLAEGLERLVYKNSGLNGKKATTSSGWATHIDSVNCKASASRELYERDAAMNHWLTKKPFYQLDENSLPSWIQSWKKRVLEKTEFSTLKLLLGCEGYVPIVTAIFLSEMGKGIMSHCTAPSLDSAAFKAISEAGGLARGVLGRRKNIDNVLKLDSSRASPWDHANYYAYEEKIPHWLFGESLHWKMAKAMFEGLNRQEKPDLPFHLVSSDLLSVGFCEASNLQNLFFGTTQTAVQNNLINFARLGCSEAGLNLEPHYIP